MAAFHGATKKVSDPRHAGGASSQLCLSLVWLLCFVSHRDNEKTHLAHLPDVAGDEGSLFSERSVEQVKPSWPKAQLYNKMNTF